MQTTTPRKIAVLVGAITFLVAAASSAHAQTLLLQLQASNYNAATGTWTATVGSNATQSNGTNTPTLVTGVTPNGSSAVHFDGSNDYLSLVTSISQTPLSGDTGFTVFAVIEPNAISGGNGGTIFAGGQGSFHYRIASLHQDIVRQAQADLGAGTGTLATSSFSIADATTSSGSGGTYRLNGVADGTSVASSFSSSITSIGSHNNNGQGEFFSGNIAEIRIYSGVMTDAQRLTVENELTASYVTAAAIPEPSTYALILGSVCLLGVLVRRKYSHRV